jgi:integrase
MTGKCSVVLVQMKSGERMPLLVDGCTGLGLFEPTGYALMLRNKNRATNTIVQAMRSVMLLYQILDENIDLLQRIRANELLTLGEIEALLEQCKLKKADLNEIYFGPVDDKVARIDLAKLKKGLKAKANLATVDRGTAAVRVKYIKGYLEWLQGYAYLQKLPEDRELFKNASDMTVKAIKARMPKTGKKNATKRKKGLTHTWEARLLSVMHPDSPENPWGDAFVRERNYLIVLLLLVTGARKGELLGVKIKDFDVRENKLLVARRPDDPEDPRPRPACAKTYDRELLLGSELVDSLKRYIKVVRATTDGAKKHPYLIVSAAGEPLALNSVDFMFSTVRAALPEIEKLSAHILRHTWNDRFSEFAQNNLAPADEKKTRNYIMGWSESSRSAENYTARYVEIQAALALTAMQNKMFKATT